uniref:Uncharacterized protein n=1 Tax=Timema monikensis TaxID=170555 RepID=A0A7R9EIB3_9NEOP|nr:unnamed protein product [Timema monikensis]
MPSISGTVLIEAAQRRRLEDPLLHGNCHKEEWKFLVLIEMPMELLKPFHDHRGELTEVHMRDWEQIMSPEPFPHFPEHPHLLPSLFSP